MRYEPDAPGAHDDAFLVCDAVLVHDARPVVQFERMTKLQVIVGILDDFLRRVCHVHGNVLRGRVLTVARVVGLLDTRVRVQGMRLPDSAQLRERLEDEDDRDEDGETLLREAGDVPH